jgi:hypothetical protein
MANAALAVLESALRARKLDRTLTTALPPLARTNPSALVPTDVATLDACLGGGLPRGQLSEITGSRSSGRTTLLLQVMAAATRRGEIVAYVDTFDRFDTASAVTAGVDLDRLLWVRGQAITRMQGSGPSSPGSVSLIERAIDRALKALNLVLQAGGFSVVALDCGDVPLPALKRIPYATWLRVQRTIEGSDTACLVVVPEPMARSAGGLTLSLGAAAQWVGESDRSRRLSGLDVVARVVSPRRRVEGEVRLGATTAETGRSGIEARRPS